VKIQIGEQLEVQGPKGKLTVPIPAGISVEQKDGKLEVIRDSAIRTRRAARADARAGRQCRAGRSTGFTRELDIVGIGYRADVKGKVATFTLGYSHPIESCCPAWI
jgi:large subunit ribosomal protein L6